MNRAVSMRQRAASLMRLALSMLDEAGDKTTATAHLQMALDRLAEGSASEPGHALSRGAQTVANPELVRAFSGAMAVLGCLLEGKSIATVEEVSDLLGLYAVVTNEISPDEGMILACWAGILRDVAQRQGGRVRRH